MFIILEKLKNEDWKTFSKNKWLRKKPLYEFEKNQVISLELKGTWRTKEHLSNYPDVGQKRNTVKLKLPTTKNHYIIRNHSLIRFK